MDCKIQTFGDTTGEYGQNLISPRQLFILIAGFSDMLNLQINMQMI